MLGRIITRHTLVHLLAMIAVVLAGLLIAKAPATAHAELNVNSPLLVTTRTSLQVCAQTSSALKSRSGAILNQLSQRMQTLRNTHPQWNKVHGPATAAPPFNSNCTVKIPTTLLDEADATMVGNGLVTKPSPFRAVVLVLDDRTADVVLGNRNVSHAAYEMMQTSEHEAVEVTNAVVVRENFINTQEFVDQYLSVAVSLEPIKPYAPPAGEKSPTIKPNN